MKIIIKKFLIILLLSLYIKKVLKIFIQKIQIPINYKNNNYILKGIINKEKYSIMINLIWI